MRNISKWLAVGALLASGSAVLVAAEPSTPATHPAHGVRITKPWSTLSDLTDDQKTQILAIHEKSVQDADAIRAKEKADIMALLTDDQKKELAENEAKAHAEATAARHRHTEATTKPAE